MNGGKRKLDANERAYCRNYGSPLLNSTSFLAKTGFTQQALNQQSRYLVEISEYRRNMQDIPTRHILTMMCFYCLFNVTILRVNMNIALVKMVKEPIRSMKTHIGAYNGTICIDLLNATTNRTIKEYSGEFNWSPPLQGQVLGAYQIGTVLTPIPFSIMASRMHASKWILGLGSLLSGFLCLFTPVIARWNVYALFAVRVFQGLGAGVSFPSLHSLIGNWIPKNERSRVNAFMYNGIALGTIATYALSGPLMESGFLGGWPAVFYISGLLMAVWFVIWVFVAYESPQEHPRISKEELDYIKEEQAHKADIAASSIPWKSILTSVPVWALIICHFCNNWTFFTLITQLPTYLANVLFFDIIHNGLISALPYLVGALTSTIASIIADFLLKKQLHITTVRKIMTSIAFFFPAACLVLIPVVGCIPSIIIALFTLANGFNTFKYSGNLITNVDMTPKYAGIIMALTGTFANFAGFLAPVYAGWITKTGHTLENWAIIFITTVVILVVGGTVFNVFGSAALQPWGGDTEKTETDTTENN